MSPTLETLTDPLETLDAIMRMVRIGLPQDGTVTDLQKRLSGMIARLSAEYRRNPLIFGNKADALRLQSVEADYLYQNGRHHEAAEKLKPLWRELQPRLQNWHPKNSPLEPTHDGHLLRQQIWALLHYVFYEFYTIQGDYPLAIRHYQSIEKVISKELERPPSSSTKDKGYNPHGTWAVFHYFLGHCYRASRDFSAAQRHFSEAMQFSRDRLEKKLLEAEQQSIDPNPELIDEPGFKLVDKEYETHYCRVFTARVVGIGLGWLALHQGQLRHAISLLRAADTLLLDTRHEYLKLFVTSVLWIAIRRATPFDSPEYKIVIKELQECFGKFKEIHDRSGMSRCASELMRSYLDLAQFVGSDDAVLTERLGAAEHWYQELGNSHDIKSKTRYHLQQARRLMIQQAPTDAKQILREAKHNAKGYPIYLRLIEMFEGEIYLKEGKADKAAEHLQIALDLAFPYTSNFSRAIPQGHTDPVFEAECYLLLSRCSYLLYRYADADKYFHQWESLASFVENYYLRHLAERVRGIQKKGPDFPSTPFEFPIRIDSGNGHMVIKTLKERIEEYEEFLVGSVIRREGVKVNSQEFADISGESRYHIYNKLNPQKKKTKKH